jgi:hypothetical protein
MNSTQSEVSVNNTENFKTAALQVVVGVIINILLIIKVYVFGKKKLSSLDIIQKVETAMKDGLEKAVSGSLITFPKLEAGNSSQEKTPDKISEDVDQVKEE